MATFAGVGISERTDPFTAGREAAKLALYQLHHKEITLGILFSTIHFADQRLLEGVAYSVGNIKLIGCSGAAVISASGIKKYGVGIMLVSSDKISAGTAATGNIADKGARAAGEELARQALKNLGRPERDLALVFSDGLLEHGSELLSGIKNVLGLSFPIFGASSADNFRFNRTFQYFDGHILTDSAVGAILCAPGTRDSFGIGIRHGWKPLSKPYLVTESKGNCLKKIAGKPAAAIYEDYFGKTRPEIQKSLNRISTYYPLGLYVPGEAEYLLRNALRIDEDGGLVCQGNAAAGSEVRLMMGTKEWALDAATQAVQEAKNALQNNQVIKAAIVLESFSRNRLLGRLAQEEVSRIRAVLGDAPLLGVCTYGEQAPLKSLTHYGETYFHNETLAVLTLA